MSRSTAGRLQLPPGAVPPSPRQGGRPPGVRVDAALLRSLRERAGLSRSDLADLVGTTLRTIQRVENDGLVGMPLLRQLCESLGVEATQVLRRDGASIWDSLRAHGLAPSAPPPLLGRDAELDRLHQRLVTRAAAPVLVIEGPLGVGKTSLAQRLAQDLRTHFVDGVVWVQGDVDDSPQMLRAIARALGFESALPPIDGHDGRDPRQAFAAHFSRGERLLILDDVTEPAHVRALSAAGEHTRVLVTTRFRHVAEELAVEPLRLAPLDDDTIIRVLSAGLDHARLACDEVVLRKMLQLVGGLPGAAAAINAALKRERLATLDSWLARFEDGASERDEPPARGVFSVFERSLRPQLSSSAWQVFVAMGAFACDPAPLSGIAQAAELPLATTRAAASELLDASVAELHPISAADPVPWLRLTCYPAAAARAFLGSRVAEVRARSTRPALVRAQAEEP